jgi:hypothetical protein
MASLPSGMRPANPDGVFAALRTFMDRALSAPAPANDDLVLPPTAPPLTKGTARAVDTARLHLRHGNPGAYARAIAGEHRAANERQQRALEAVIACDGQERLFSRHPANGCLLAVEG